MDFSLLFHISLIRILGGIAYRIILQCCDIGLHCLLHVPVGNEGSGQIDVAIDKVGFQSHRVPVVLEGQRQLTALLVHVAEVAARDKAQSVSVIRRAKRE